MISDRADYYFDEFRSFFTEKKLRDLTGDLEVFKFGYRRGLALCEKKVERVEESEQELERLVFRALTTVSSDISKGEARKVFLVGSGFFWGLREGGEISLRLFNRLKNRLEQFLREQFSEEISLSLEELFSESSNIDRKLVRKKATLVKFLRQNGAAFWREVHRALYQPSLFSEQKIEDLISSTELFLRREGLYSSLFKELSAAREDE